jgi:two-component system, cell cycle sensor histidine kinase and response regulator CckA
VAEKTNLSSSSTEGFPAEYYAALLAGLIHKLNNIITVLSGHTGLLLLEQNLKGDIFQQVQHMSRAADLLSRYIDETAVVIRPVPLFVESVNLSELVDSLAPPAGLAIRKQFGGRIKVRTDRRKLKEIFEHLLRNASEAEAKSVVVTAESRSGFVEVTFRDDGHGIKPPLIPKIFDPFFTTRKQEENFGIGLFRARGELARMKGEISATSDGKAQTDLLVRLPAA